MKQRIIAAWEAFKDPMLVGEAKGMRVSLHRSYKTGMFDLIHGEIHKGHVLPIITALNYRDCTAIRNYLQIIKKGE